MGLQRSFRFVKVTSFYKNYLNAYYESHPEIKSLSYREQYDHLMDQAYGYSNFFENRMKELGNDAAEIVYNARHLQDTWAKEHNIRNRSELELIADQLKDFKAEVVLFQDSHHFSGQYIRSLKEQVPSLKLVMGICCFSLSDSVIRNMADFDLLLSCSPHFVQTLREHGLKSFLFYHSFEDSLADRMAQTGQAKQNNVLFAGSFISGQDYHSGRKEIIEHLLENNVPMRIISNIDQITGIRLLLRQFSYDLVQVMGAAGLKGLVARLSFLKKAAVLTERPKSLGFSKKFLECTETKDLYGLNMLKELSRSRIGLNVHVGVAGNYAANIRMFEVTGVGSILVTDYKENISDLFEPDREIITYRSREECLEKILWLLSHEAECDSIALAGQKRTLKDHSVRKRMEQLSEIVRENL